MKNTSEKIIKKILSKADVIDKQIGKLGEDKTQALLILKGIPFDDNSAFYKKLYLVVIADNEIIKQELKPGYNPKMTLLDFTGNVGDEIYITIDSGGSGGFQFFYVFEFVDSMLKTLVDDEIFNVEFDDFKGQYLDYYKVKVSDGENNVYLIDLSCKGNDYLSQIYDEQGKLINERKAYISDANYSYPAYNQREEIFELIVYQRITGLYNADNLGYLVTKLSFGDENSKRPARTHLETAKQPNVDCVFRY